jgi:2-phospho-L-lactate guanylyltransferase
VPVGWTVLVPIKRLELAKTRLRPALDPADHRALVLAMARDTIAAVAASTVVDQLAVITSDPAATGAGEDLGAAVVDDGPELNAALRDGARRLRTGAVAALPADLPALRPQELTAALVVAEQHLAAGAPQCFLADRHRIGTTLLAAATAAALVPRFGADSANAHARSGAVELSGDWPGLRLDVDTVADLADAAALGLGPASTAVLARRGDDTAIVAPGSPSATR